MRRIIGNIGCFPLPDGRFGFGRIFSDACVAFYRHIGTSPHNLPPDDDYAFTVGLYDRSVAKMKLAEKRPFQRIEEVTAPPMAIQDPITGAYSIYQNGEITPASDDACKNLEICAVWTLEQVIDRLLNDEKWTPALQPPAR